MEENYEEQDQNSLIKNQELVEYPKNLEKLNKWVISAVPSKQIYKQGMFDLMSRFAVKTIEKTVQVSDNAQTIYLLEKKDLESFKNYHYIHIGLI
jgi:hypothetical protein